MSKIGAVYFLPPPCRFDVIIFLRMVMDLMVDDPDDGPTALNLTTIEITCRVQYRTNICKVLVHLFRFTSI